jgi:hypothetical protein
MIWRPPTIIECLDIASRMGSVPIERLLDRPILTGLDLAVDDPPPDRSLDPREQAALRTARMIDRLLCITDLPEPERTIERVVRQTFESSVISWTTDPVGAAMLIKSYSRSTAESATLAEHLIGHLSVAPEPDQTDWVELFSTHEDAPLHPQWVFDHTADRRFPTIYVANALTHLRPESEPHLESLRYAVLRGLDAALARIVRPCPIRMVQPSYLMTHARVQKAPSAWWDMFFDWLVTDADGLIISDVGGRAPGFGAAVEATVFLSQHGPTLDIREKGCGAHSTHQDALTPLLGAQIEPNVDLGDGMAVCCAAWLTEMYEDVLAAHRRRSNERILNLGLHQFISKLIGEASQDALHHALHRSRLSPGKAMKIVEDIDHLSDIAKHQIDALLGALMAPARVKAQREPPQIDMPALLKAGEIKGWSHERMYRLWNAAREELRLTGAEHRLRLMDPNDWIMLDERLRG